MIGEKAQVKVNIPRQDVKEENRRKQHPREQGRGFQLVKRRTSIREINELESTLYPGHRRMKLSEGWSEVNYPVERS